MCYLQFKLRDWRYNQDSWNNHRVSGPNRGIPIERALENNRIAPLDAVIVPHTEQLLREYRNAGGRINENMSDLFPFDNIQQNDNLLNLLSDSFNQTLYNSIYNRMLSGDVMAILELIRQHMDIVLTFAPI